jgi:hypothetical protein
MSPRAACLAGQTGDDREGRQAPPYPRAGPAGLLCSPYPRAGPRPQADPTTGRPLVTTAGPPRRLRSHAVARILHGPPAPSPSAPSLRRRTALRPHRPLPSRAMGHPTAPHKRTRRRTSAPAQAHDAAHNVCTRTSAHAQAHPPTQHTTCARRPRRRPGRGADRPATLPAGGPGGPEITPVARARRGGSLGAPSDHAA